MDKFRVTVRRIIREDVEIEVEADNAEAAIEAAKIDATSVPLEKWDCYDCEYHADESDAKAIAH